MFAPWRLLAILEENLPSAFFQSLSIFRILFLSQSFFYGVALTFFGQKKMRLWMILTCILFMIAFFFFLSFWLRFLHNFWLALGILFGGGLAYFMSKFPSFYYFLMGFLYPFAFFFGLLDYPWNLLLFLPSILCGYEIFLHSSSWILFLSSLLGSNVLAISFLSIFPYPSLYYPIWLVFFFLGIVVQSLHPEQSFFTIFKTLFHRLFAKHVSNKRWKKWKEKWEENFFLKN